LWILLLLIWGIADCGGTFNNRRQTIVPHQSAVTHSAIGNRQSTMDPNAPIIPSCARC
jgi:hypothetical protein